MDDDEFFTLVVDQLRANRAGQGPELHPNCNSPIGPSSPKTDPNTNPVSTLLPAIMTALTKHGIYQQFDTQAQALTESRSEDLDLQVDGWVVLNELIMGYDAERVYMMDFEESESAVRVTLLGVDIQPSRIYEIHFPKNTKDFLVQQRLTAFRLRWRARKEWSETNPVPSSKHLQDMWGLIQKVNDKRKKL